MFIDRVEAGRLLARSLKHLRGHDFVVLGLARGGVVVAAEVAAELAAPLDVVVVRKLGVPLQPELGMGAIGEEGVRIINRQVVALAGVTEGDVADVEKRERAELERRVRRFREERSAVPVVGRTAVVIDDGIATGFSAQAGCEVARARGAARVVLAVPVAPPNWTAAAGAAADELVCLATPPDFSAVGQFYRDFPQTTDEEVVECLHRIALAAHRAPEQLPRGTTQPVSSIDPVMERARDEANGLEVFGDPYADEMLLAEREEAEGVELFEEAEVIIPATALRQGSPGHEALVGDQLGLGPGQDEESPDRDAGTYEEYLGV